MTNAIIGSMPRADDAPDSDQVPITPVAFRPDLPEAPNAATLATRVFAVLTPWSIESKEAVSGAVRNFLAVELEDIGRMKTEELAWAVAELVVARQEEVLASGGLTAQQGLLNLAELARMFEHVFLAKGGAQLDGAG